MTVAKETVRDEREQYAFHDDITYLRETKAGLTEATVREISETKGEPAWMLEYRLRAFKHFEARAMPMWGGDLTKLDFSKIVYYRKPSEREEKSWDDVPDQIKKTFERLGIPEAERKFLSGVGAQYDSEVVYHSVREDLQKLGVVFMGTDQGMKEYPEIFKKYFGTVVPAEDNKFAALNSAVWSGGSFVYVPKGVEVKQPFVSVTWTLTEGVAVFPHALVIAGERAQATLHDFHLAARPDQRALAISAADIHAGPGAQVHRLAVQAWGAATQSFQVDNTCGGRDAVISSVNAAVGSRRARLENCVRIDGPGADVSLFGISVATGEQEFDQRTLQIHAAGHAKSDLLFKNALLGKARTIFSGLIKVAPDAQRTDAYQTNRNLILNEGARADTIPFLEIETAEVKCSHAGAVGRVDDEHLFYLMSRGLTQEAAMSMVVNGFIEPVTRTLPMEYAVEWSRLIELQMEGSVG